MAGPRSVRREAAHTRILRASPAGEPDPTVEEGSASSLGHRPGERGTVLITATQRAGGPIGLTGVRIRSYWWDHPQRRQRLPSPRKRRSLRPTVSPLGTALTRRMLDLNWIRRTHHRRALPVTPRPPANGAAWEPEATGHCHFRGAAALSFYRRFTSVEARWLVCGCASEMSVVAGGLGRDVEHEREADVVCDFEVVGTGVALQESLPLQEHGARLQPITGPSPLSTTLPAGPTAYHDRSDVPARSLRITRWPTTAAAASLLWPCQR